MLAKKTIAILMINAVVLNPSSVVSVEKKAHKMGSNVQATRTMETNSGALEDLHVSIMNMVHEKFLSSKLQKIFKNFFRENYSKSASRRWAWVCWCVGGVMSCCLRGEAWEGRGGLCFWLLARL